MPTVSSLDSSVLDAKIDGGAGCARMTLRAWWRPGKIPANRPCESFPVVRVF
jgi:hypothetical protein